MCAGVPKCPSARAHPRDVGGPDLLTKITQLSAPRFLWLSPAHPKQRPGASRLCPHQRQKQDPSSTLCSTPHHPFPNQGSTYFTPKQSRHELICIQRRCTGDYDLPQNQKKPSSDKLERKNLGRLSKLHASEYIGIIISF